MKHKILLLLLFTIAFCFIHPIIAVAQNNPSNQNKDAVFSFYIPNAFTPNNDGINDEFYGKGEGILKYDMWVFDRWGNLIFHGKELNEGWNGKSNDESDVVQQDVYIWKVLLTDVFNNEHDYIGTVTLVR